jgi:hypothetical protein
MNKDDKVAKLMYCINSEMLRRTRGPNPVKADGPLAQSYATEHGPCAGDTSSIFHMAGKHSQYAVYAIEK